MTKKLFTRRLAAAASLSVLAAFAAPAARAGEVEARVRSTGVVRVCIWPEYFGVTWRNPVTGVLGGLDIEMSAELGRDLKARVEYVDSSFGQLIPDLQGGRCDVAMFAVAMLAQRVEQLAFTRPYLASDIFGITVKGSRVVRDWADIDKPGVMVAVQAGTFMEPVMAARLKQAQLVRVKPPATRERELQAGRVDVFMSDYPYSQGLLANADWAVRVPSPTPFFVLPYAYAMSKGDDAWLATLDQFVDRVRKDGRLEKAARANGLLPIMVR